MVGDGKAEVLADLRATLVDMTKEVIRSVTAAIAEHTNSHVHIWFKLREDVTNDHFLTYRETLVYMICRAAAVT